MHILNEFFDEIYCINLVERPDRRKQIEKRFKQLGIKFTFYNAVKFGWLDKLYKYFKEDNIGDFEYSAQIGCMMSHYSVIKTAHDKKLRNVLIFEDDASFLKNFNKIISKYINNIPKDWDMIYLASNIWGWEKQHIDVVPNLIKRAYKANGAWAYGVNSKFYNTILNGIDNKIGIIDNYYMRLQQDNKNKIYTCVPNLCMQGYSYSDLIEKETNYYHTAIVSYMGKKPEDYID